MRRVFRHPTAEGGKGKIVGKSGGQSFNTREIAKMLDGNSDEQMKALVMLRKSPAALAYVGALHNSEGVRSIAISYLEDPYHLLTVANSSPHYDSVVQSFEKLGKMMDKLEGRISITVACHSPFEDDRLNALNRTRKLVEEGKTFMIGTHYAQFGYDEGEDADIHTMITKVRYVDRMVLSASPYNKEDVEKRRYVYSSGAVENILEKEA